MHYLLSAHLPFIAPLVTLQKGQMGTREALDLVPVRDLLQDAAAKSVNIKDRRVKVRFRRLG